MRLKFLNEEVEPNIFKINITQYEVSFHFKYLSIKNHEYCSNELVFSVIDLDKFIVKFDYLPKINYSPRKNPEYLKELIDIIQRFIDNNTDLILSNINKAYSEAINQTKSKLEYTESSYNGFKEQYSKELLLI